MSFLQDIARSVKQGYAQAEADKLLKPYGVRLRELIFNPDGKFFASLELEGDREELHVSGQLSFDVANRARFQDIRTERTWVNRVLAKHVLGRELPIPPAQAKQLRDLFPA